MRTMYSKIVETTITESLNGDIDLYSLTRERTQDALKVEEKITEKWAKFSRAKRQYDATHYTPMHSL